VAVAAVLRVTVVPTIEEITVLTGTPAALTSCPVDNPVALPTVAVADKLVVDIVVVTGVATVGTIQTHMSPLANCKE
jgi:hypothetical protein